MNVRISPIAVAALLSVSSLQPVFAQAPTRPELREELLRMQEADQAARDLRLETPEEIRVLSAVDALNTARLKQLIDAHGWPTIGLVGDDGAGAAWLLAQHADADPDFQRRVLGLLEPLVARGEVKASNYAYLWDRTHTPQRYGTQGRCTGEERWEPREIESPEGVDARRAEAGLPPMAEYEKLVSSHCRSQ